MQADGVCNPYGCSKQSPRIEEASAVCKIGPHHDKGLETEQCWTAHEGRFAKGLHARRYLDTT